MSENFLLKGIKVVELATFIAAPSCAKILADWGADVIKVEPLSGEAMRTVGSTWSAPTHDDECPMFELENFNKKSICVNMKTDEGKEVMEKLLLEADVFVTNVRTAALIKLGLSYDQLKEKYPKLVFSQILGYGEEGPLKNKPGFDYTAFFARGGVMSTLMEKGTSPANGAAGFGDHYAGITLAGGTCAALLKQARTGMGEKITVSLYHTAIYGLASMIVAGQYGNEMPLSRLSPNSAVANSYQCSDEKWIQLAILQYDAWSQKFFKAIEREELLKDERFSTNEKALKNAEALVPLINEAIGMKAQSEWEIIFTEADLPFEKVQSCEDIVECEQAWANEYLVKKVYDNGNEGVLVNTPVKAQGMGIREMTQAPKVSEYTDEILEQFGYSIQEIQTLKELKAVQ